jgi:hypothetical protein
VLDDLDLGSTEMWPGADQPGDVVPATNDLHALTSFLTAYDAAVP